MKTSKLYVGNLNYQTSEHTLREAFSEYGEVVSVRILEGRGFGFVEMGSIEEAEKAREGMNGKEVDGRPLRVEEARPPRPRTRRRF
ncbi:RNA-binding protein [Candidatus Calescamantes bacterium]|nr:RNA-binding protein [Candidatus Calescamantes bacterium]